MRKMVNNSQVFRTIVFRGLDPQKFDEVPGFKFNQYTKDIKDDRTVVCDVGSNPWVQRVQRIGRSDRSIIRILLKIIN